jgi:hypothetical protein
MLEDSISISAVLDPCVFRWGCDGEAECCCGRICSSIGGMKGACFCRVNVAI